MSAFFHLAQFNIARALTAIDDPAMADFVAQIDEVNAAAEESPGFVWRLKAGGGAFYPAALEDPRLLVNMSVWKSTEDLRRYVFTGRHVQVFRDRARWFGAPQGPGVVAWWIPAGHITSLEEAQARLSRLGTHGPTPAAFSLKSHFPAPEIRVEPNAPQLYDNRTFALVMNTSEGETDASTVFHYRQTGPFVWATYEGGSIVTGTLVGSVALDGSLEAEYHQVNRTGLLRSGTCRSTPEVLADGRLRLHERWRWADGAAEAGESIVEEISATWRTSARANS